MDLVAFVPTTDLDRAAAFYRDVVGLEVVSVDGFACVCRSGATTVRVTLVQDLQPQQFTVLGWDVDDIGAAVEAILQRGAVFLQLDGMTDEAGVWTAPSGSRIAWFHDPDGNVLSLSQHPRD